MRRRWIAVALVVTTVVVLEAQTPKPTFEVASIKRRVGPGPLTVVASAQPSRTTIFTRVNNPVVSLIGWAFDLPGYRLIGGPDWARTDRFDVDARAAKEVSQDEIRLMVQSLLEDRFKLKTHREERQMPIYTLVRARSEGRLGPNIAPIDDCAKPVSLKEPIDAPRGGAHAGGCNSMEGFARAVSNQIGAPVIDKTGLAGLWQFIYYYAPDRSRLAGRLSLPPDLPPNDPNLPSFEQALQEQLGLKLEAGRGPVDVLVIDSVQQPTEN